VVALQAKGLGPLGLPFSGKQNNAQFGLNPGKSFRKKAATG